MYSIDGDARRRPSVAIRPMEARGSVLHAWDGHGAEGFFLAVAVRALVLNVSDFYSADPAHQKISSSPLLRAF